MPFNMQRLASVSPELNRHLQDELRRFEKYLFDAGGGLKENFTVIQAVASGALTNATYEWGFGKSIDTVTNNGVSIYVPSDKECHIIAMSLTTNDAGGTTVVEADVNGTPLGVSADVEVQLSGRSSANDSFTPYKLTNGDRLNFRTRIAGINNPPSIAAAWLRYRKI